MTTQTNERKPHWDPNIYWGPLSLEGRKTCRQWIRFLEIVQKELKDAELDELLIILGYAVSHIKNVPHHIHGARKLCYAALVQSRTMMMLVDEPGMPVCVKSGELPRGLVSLWFEMCRRYPELDKEFSD